MNTFKKLLAGLVVAAVSATANAALFDITINATVTQNAGLDGIVDIGDALEFHVVVDDTNPDFDGSGGSYVATNDSPMSGFFLVPVTGTGSVDTFNSFTWRVQGTLDASAAAPGLFLPYAVIVNGVGMTHDQIMPDFTGPVTGSLILDMGALVAGETIDATVTSISIAPVTAVPVPAAAWLFVTALSTLIGIKRRK